jgi:hypothetical protein
LSDNTINAAMRINGDYRGASLRIVPDTVKVHHVNWVKWDTTPFGVLRHRSEMREPKC